MTIYSLDYPLFFHFAFLKSHLLRFLSIHTKVCDLTLYAEFTL